MRSCGSSRWLVLLFACVAFRAGPVLAAAPKPTAGTTQKVVKFLGTTSEFAGGVSSLYLLVAPADGGAPVKLILTEEARRKIITVAAERGDLVSITVKTG